MDGDLLKDSTQIDQHVEAKVAATPRARRSTRAAARPSRRRRRHRRRRRRRLLARKELLENGSLVSGALDEVRAEVLHEHTLVLTLEGREARLVRVWVRVWVRVRVRVRAN